MLDYPLLFGVWPGNAFAGLGVFEEALTVPDTPADVEFVVQNAGAGMPQGLEGLGGYPAGAIRRSYVPLKIPLAREYLSCRHPWYLAIRDSPPLSLNQKLLRHAQVRSKADLWCNHSADDASWIIGQGIGRNDDSGRRSSCGQHAHRASPA